MLRYTKNIRVIALVIARRFGDIITIMPCIRALHLRVMVRRKVVSSSLERFVGIPKLWSSKKIKSNS